MKNKKNRKLLPKVLFRVLPITLVVMTFISLFTRQIAVNTVQTEVEKNLRMRATDASSVISARINEIKQDTRNLSNNDLVVNGLIDMTARHNYLPMFFQSLKIAGPYALESEITLTDYKGRYIISNTGREIGYSKTDLFKHVSNNREVLEVSAERFLFALPVKYSGLVEGMLVVTIEGRMMSRLFRFEWSEMTSVLLDKKNSVIISSNQDNTHKLITTNNDINELEYFVSDQPVDAYPGLRLISGILKKQAFQQIERLDTFLIWAMLLNLVTLVAGIVFSSLMSTRPLAVFSSKLKDIRERHDFHDRLPETGPREFGQLARSFNELQSDLLASVVFSEQLEEKVEERTRKLKDLQTKLVNRAIESGRAQLSAMILHNIGNAMTPVSVKVNQLKQDELEQISRYLRQSYQDLSENSERLTEYVNKDDRGTQVFVFMGKLIGSLEQQRAEFKNSLEKISEAIKYVSEIISLQQNYAARESENKELTNINQLLDDAIKMQITALEKREIKIHRETDPDLPLITIDRNKLMQVIVNLIKNGYEAIDEAKKDAGEKFITLRTLKGENELRIEVGDSGIGIEPERIEKIFQFGESGKGSSGFGLYYCKMFVEANNGKLTIHSKGIGKGATVLIIFKSKKA